MEISKERLYYDPKRDELVIVRGNFFKKGGLFYDSDGDPFEWFYTIKRPKELGLIYIGRLR